MAGDVVTFAGLLTRRRFLLALAANLARATGVERAPTRRVEGARQTAFEDDGTLGDGAARTLGVDLIIMASRRPELEDYLIGSNAARVVRHAHLSVLVVR